MYNNIKEYRNHFGLSQMDLAMKMNVDKTTVSSWERDRTEPNMETVKRLCEIFHCTISDLFPINTKPSPVETAMDLMLEMNVDQLDRLIAYAARLRNVKNED